jgi:sulfonate transport system substrate-binding protein
MHLIGRRGLLASGLLLAAAACSRGASGERLRIGYQRSGVLFLAHSRGILEKRLAERGIALEWAEFPSGPPLVEAMNAGAVDFGAVGDTPLVYAQAAGVDVRLVAAQVYRGKTAGSAFLTLPGRPIASVAALKGRRIGFTKGSSAEVAALSALADAGLTIADVTPVRLAPSDGVAALEQGSLDALFTWDPYFTLAQSTFGAVETRFDRPGLLTVTLYIARTPIARPPATALHALLDGLRAEAAWANANLGEARRILAGAARLPEVDIARILARLGPIPFHVDPPTDEVVTNQQRVADRLAEARAIAAGLDVRRTVDRGWKPA